MDRLYYFFIRSLAGRVSKILISGAWVDIPLIVPFISIHRFLPSLSMSIALLIHEPATLKSSFAWIKNTPISSSTLLTKSAQPALMFKSINLHPSNLFSPQNLDQYQQTHFNLEVRGRFFAFDVLNLFCLYTHSTHRNVQMGGETQPS